MAGLFGSSTAGLSICPGGRGYDVRPTDEGPVSASLCHPHTPRPVGRVHALAVSRGPQTPAGRVLGPGAGHHTWPTLEETLHGDSGESLPVPRRRVYPTHQQLQRAGHAYEYGLSEGHPWLSF